MKIILNNDTDNMIEVNQFFRSLAYEDDNIIDLINFRSSYSQTTAQYFENLITSTITQIKLIDDMGNEVFVLTNKSYSFQSIQTSIHSSGSYINITIQE